MFYVVCLTRKNRPLGRHRVTVGTATAALAHPREVFRAAILASAAAIVCVHNQVSKYHPKLAEVAPSDAHAPRSRNSLNKKPPEGFPGVSNWVQGRDLNPRPSGYEPDELPGCSTLQ